MQSVKSIIVLVGFVVALRILTQIGIWVYNLITGKSAAFEDVEGSFFMTIVILFFILASFAIGVNL